MNAHLVLTVVAAGVLTALGIVLAPVRRKPLALFAVVGLVATLATVPAFATFAGSPAGHPAPSPQLSFGAYTISSPGSIACQWEGAQKTTLTWTNGSSWATTQVQRQDNGGGYSDYGTAVTAGLTNTDDNSVTSPASHTYSYRVYHVQGSWSSLKMGTSNTTGTAVNIVGGNSLYCKDGIATLASNTAPSKLNSPYDVARDSSGNYYIVDQTNHEIRKITASTGVISTIAGTGSSGSTDGVAATSGKLASPRGIAVNSAGDIFIADTANQAIRYIPAGAYTTNDYGMGNVTAGYIYTIAGSIGQTSGNGTYDSNCSQNAVGQKLNSPRDVAVDSNGVVYITDAGNSRLVKVRTDGKGCAFAGLGASFQNGVAATSTTVSQPEGITVDSSNNVIFADKSNNEIRMVAAVTCNASCSYGLASYTAGNIYNVAGLANGTSGSAGDANTAIGSAINNPWNVAVNSNGSLLFSDEGNKYIRLVYGGSGNAYGASGTVAGKMYIIAGVANTTAYSGQGMPLRAAGNNSTVGNAGDPYGVTFDGTNNSFLWVDNAKNVLRKGDGTNNLMITWAGNGTASGGVGGDGSASYGWELQAPTHGAVDSSGNLYFGDPTDNRVREWVASTGYVRIIAGVGNAQENGDGSNALAANLKGADGVACDSTCANLYVADSGGDAIRKIDLSNNIGNISTVGGPSGGSSCTTSCGENVAGASASTKFQTPVDLAVDSHGSIFISDAGNCTVRVIWHTGSPTYGLTLGSANQNGNYGSLTDGNIYKIAGTYGTCSSTGDGGYGNNGATLYTPEGIDLDGSGNVYVAEKGGFRIRKINASDGKINTFAGNGTNCAGTAWSNNTSATAANATICHPSDVAWDSNTSALYITEPSATQPKVACIATAANAACGQSTATANNIYSVAGGGTNGVGGWAQDASLSFPMGVASGPSGSGNNLYLISNAANADLRIVTGADP